MVHPPLIERLFDDDASDRKRAGALMLWAHEYLMKGATRLWFKNRLLVADRLPPQGIVRLVPDRERPLWTESKPLVGPHPSASW